MCSKPGEKALEALKKLNSEVSLFKVPKAPLAKKPKMKLLTEEEYIEVFIAHILYLFECDFHEKLLVHFSVGTW